MIICISGSPGTGKTTLAKKLRRILHARYLDANALLVKEKLYTEYDKTRKTYEIEPKTFKKRILKEIAYFEKNHPIKRGEKIQSEQIKGLLVKKGNEPSLFLSNLSTKAAKSRLKKILIGVPVIIVDSHLSHLIPPEKVDFCIITITSLKKMAGRLQKRGYSQLKIKENLEAEAFETCKIEALEAGHKVFTFHT